MEDGDIPCTPQVEQNYTYAFNICNAVSSGVPKNCPTGAAALQIDRRATFEEDDDLCWIAGRFEATNQKQSEQYFSLLDEHDPTKGVALTMYGDNCKHNQEGEEVATQREFRLEFECADVAVAVPIHALEYSHCHYTVTIPSVFGCPTECPLAGMSLCNGKGHCAYDTDVQSARCFCDTGYTGDDCTLTTSETEAVTQKSSSLTGLIVTLFVLITFLVGAVVVMFKQVRAYKEDNANYMALAGGDMDGDTINGV